MRDIIITGILAAALAGAAMAASPTFYVVRALDSKLCTAETSKPDAKKGLVMNTEPYKSKKEALTAIKADPNCAQK